MIIHCNEDSMTANKNTVSLVGVVGTDPELRQFGNGTRCSKFRLAVTSKYNNSKGELVSVTEWHTILAWGEQAEQVMKELHKGMNIFMAGRLSTRQYTNRQGSTQWTTEVVLLTFQISGSTLANAA
jgi:single-strand DNA-binding protein